MRKPAARGGPSTAARVLLLVGGGSAAVLLVQALLVASATAGRLEVALDQAGVQASAALAAPGFDAWLLREGDKLLARRGAQRGLESFVKAREPIVNAYLADASGAVRLSCYKVDSLQVEPGGQAVGATSVARAVYKSGSFETAVRLYRSPLLDAQGQAVGTAGVLMGEGALGAAAGAARLAVLGGALVAMLAVLVLAAFSIRLWTAPLQALVQAVSRINRGNLHYRAAAGSAGGELGQLARAIEGMVDGLREGEAATERLDQVEREATLVAELRQALLPRSLPAVAGFEVESVHVGGGVDSADFYDAVPMSDGRLALVVASAFGQGALSALLLAMTRAYLRGYLEEGGDAGRALRTTNRHLAQGMRKGLHVTAQVAVLDPRTARATVYIAGHRAPFYACRGGDISVVHGEGLALGLDKGEVFDRRLEEVAIDMPPGTRIVLTTTGTYEFEGGDGKRFGIERFQEVVRKHAPKNSEAFVNLVLGALEAFRGEAARLTDATLVTAKRTA